MSLPPLNHHSHNRPLNKGNAIAPIKFLTSYSTNTLYDTLQARENWKETKDETNWDIVWADRGKLLFFIISFLFMSIHFFLSLELSHQIFDKIRFTHDRQKICHFRNSKELCRKDLLARNIKSFAKKKRSAVLNADSDINNTNFVPITFNLTNEYPLFVEEVSIV